jgi:hypothetical protein
MEERREIHRWQDIADPTDWTFEDDQGHEWFRRGEGESPQEMEGAGDLEVRFTPRQTSWRTRGCRP